MTKYDPVPMVYNVVEPDGGASDKAPVIFLHGLTSSKEYWYDIPKTVANATKRKAYVVDARNHGDSPWSDVFDFDCYVYDLLHLMDTIKIPKAILVGHSMGGIACTQAALRAPERVEKIFVEDMTASKIKTQSVESIYNRIALLKRAVEVMPTGLDEKSARLFIVDFILNALPPAVRQVTKFDKNGNMMQLKKTEDGRYTFKSNVDVLQDAFKGGKHIQSDVTGSYEGPACFVYGQLSPLQVCKDEETIKKHFPNAELVGIENATHSVHIDCPSEFENVLLNFLLKE